LINTLILQKLIALAGYDLLKNSVVTNYFSATCTIEVRKLPIL